MKTLVQNGILLLALAGILPGGWAQETTGNTTVSTKVVEEKTTVETKRVYQTETIKRAPRKTAIFIDNRAGPQYNDKVLFFEDQVAARAGNKNLSIISREDVLKAVKVYRGADITIDTRGTNVQTSGNVRSQTEMKTVDGNGNTPGNLTQKGELQAGPAQVRAKTTEGELHSGANISVASDTKVATTDTHSHLDGNVKRNTVGTDMDQLMSDNTSALRLAQNMGADFILFVTIGSVGKETRNYNDPSIGVSSKSTVYNLRGTYKVVEGVTGGTLGGDTIKESKTIRQSETLQVETDDLMNELLENAAAKVADSLAAKEDSFVPPTQSGKVEISIACGVKDLEGNELSLSDIRINENNTVVKDDQLLPVQASATIEIDGVAVGTTPSRFKVVPGIHKLRLTRAGFQTQELTINANDALELTPTLQLSKEGFARWKEIREYLNKLDVSRKLTDAQAEDLRAHAQMLRQSGMRVDFRINSTNAPTIIKKNSIFGQDNF